MEPLPLWWHSLPSERYWLEVTDRTDLGENLKAPQTNEKGELFWSYSLVREVRPGDVVFHYRRGEGAIAAASIGTGKVWEDLIVWAARGTYAREAGIEPHPRPGIYAGLEGFAPLPAPLTLEEIRNESEWLQGMLTDLRSRVGSPLYFPFEEGTSRPIGALQGYLFKLPADFVSHFPKLAVRAAVPIPKPTPQQIGADYRPADESTAVGQSDPFTINPEEVEKALQGHARTQNALAAAVQLRGKTPRSPQPAEPNYDLLWEDGAALYVAEVKSLKPENEERQLRLGIGQVLRYRQILTRTTKRTVLAVLATERQPSDKTWLELCEALGIALVWPESFDSLWPKVA